MLGNYYYGRGVTEANFLKNLGVNVGGKPSFMEAFWKIFAHIPESSVVKVMKKSAFITGNVPI